MGTTGRCIIEYHSVRPVPQMEVCTDYGKTSEIINPLGCSEVENFTCKTSMWLEPSIYASRSALGFDDNLEDVLRILFQNLDKTE